MSLMWFFILPLLLGCQGEVVKISGSTLAAPAMDYLTYIYSAGRNVKYTYEAVGSGTGKANLIAETHDMAVSDSFLTDTEEVAMGGLHLVPLLSTAVTVAYNVPELANTLRLTNECLVSIFNGTTNFWDSPCIQRANTHSIMPHELITLVVREDKSGTTEVFTRALNNMAPQSFPQVSSLPEWDACEAMPCWRARGNAGSAQVALAVPYSITYTALPYAGSINHVELLSSDGTVIKASVEGAQLAIDSKAQELLNNPTTSLHVDVPSAWPISALSYLVVPTTSWPRCSVAEDGLLFSMFMLEDPVAAHAMVLTGYSPIPASLASVLTERLSKLRCDGITIFDALDSFEVGLLVSSGFIGLFNILLLWGVYTKRDHAIYQLKPAVASYMRIASNIFALAAVYVWTGYPKQGQCTAMPWVTIASVYAVFSNLYFATATYIKGRQYYNLPPMRKYYGLPAMFRLSNTVTSLQILCGALSAANILLFIVWQAIDPMQEVRRECISGSSAIFVNISVSYTSVIQIVTAVLMLMAKPQPAPLTFKNYIWVESYVETSVVYLFFVPAQYALSTAIVYNPDDALRTLLAPSVALLVDATLSSVLVLAPTVYYTFKTHNGEVDSLLKVNFQYCERLRARHLELSSQGSVSTSQDEFRISSLPPMESQPPASGLGLGSDSWVDGAGWENTTMAGAETFLGNVRSGGSQNVEDSASQETFPKVEDSASQETFPKVEDSASQEFFLATMGAVVSPRSGQYDAMEIK